MIQINDLEKLVSKYAQIFKSNYSVVDGKICIKKNVNFHDTYLVGVKYRDWETDRKSTRLNSSHSGESRMPSSA